METADRRALGYCGLVARRMDGVQPPALLLVDGSSALFAVMPFRDDALGRGYSRCRVEKGFIAACRLAILGVSAKAVAARGQRKVATHPIFDFADYAERLMPSVLFHSPRPWVLY